MITNYPTPLATWEPEPFVPRLAPGERRPAPVDGAWRYRVRAGSRALLTVAIAISAGLHLLVLFGHALLPRPPTGVKHVDEPPVVRLVVPEMKDLEEPEIAQSDDARPTQELSIPVPMQADLPSLTQPNDFVQPLNIASLLEPPDLSRASLNVIPEHFIRASRIAESIGKVFNLEELDRQPQPVLQQAPTYPHAQRREGLSATVSVEFIVDTEGRVLEPVVIETTHPAFNDAALSGVSRWKFRAGTKNGRKVNVRMRVPIVFKVLDTAD